MQTHRTPVAARWTLFALGTVEGERIRLPADPVAAWLLRRSPELMPPQAVGSVLTMIRARTSIVDRMIEEELLRVKERGEGVDYWSIGGGFDARWYRTQSLFAQCVRKHTEVEIPSLLALKSALLEESTYRTAWSGIHSLPLEEDAWTVRSHGNANLVVLEGASTRLPPRRFRDLLRRLRNDAPNARVILDLPSFVSMLHSSAVLPRDAAGAEIESPHEVDNPYRWSRGFFRRLGWEILEDQWLTSRPVLDAASGMPALPGMEALRVVRMRSTEAARPRHGVASVSLAPPG